MLRSGLQLMRSIGWMGGSKFPNMQKISMATSASDPIPNPNASNLEELSPSDLVRFKHLAEGDVVKSEAILKMALSKEPEHLNGLMSMSTLLMVKRQPEEALKVLEHVMSKPCPENPLEFSTARLVAPQMAATWCLNLGKPHEAFGYLKPLASLKEPEHPIAKGYYYGGIGMLGVILFEVGRMDEAAKYEMIMYSKDPAGHAERIPHLPPGYREFVKSLKYV